MQADWQVEGKWGQGGHVWKEVNTSEGTGVEILHG